MGVDVGHAGITARRRPHRAMMVPVPNVPSATMLSRTIKHLLVGFVSRALFRQRVSFQVVTKANDFTLRFTKKVGSN